MSKAYIPVDNGPNWWRDILGYGGKYRVNRCGDVQRVFKSGLVRDMTPYRKQGRRLRNRLFVKLTDNHADNIGFISRSGLGKLTGHMADRRKCVFKITETGEEVEVYRSAREAAKANNMSCQTVLDRCHNKVKCPFALDGYTYQFEK